MDKPLALKMAPKSLSEIIGQKHLVGEGKILSNLVKNKKMFSMILYGKPGIGKTSIATAMINDLDLRYRMLNATTSTKKDLDIVIEEAKMYDGLILILDEIHRLNKDKQDILLPALESGLITLVGMTTSNPYHAINPAIRSRCQLFELHELETSDIIEGLKKAVESPYLPDIEIDDKSIELIAKLSGNDLRYAYNLLEISYYSTDDKKVNEDKIRLINSKPVFFSDKNGDGHYDVLSGLQKSIRGSDVDAALYYLAKLCAAGDLDSIERRLLVTAYEDVGLANPNAVNRCATAIESAKKVGFPEAIIPLAFTVCDLALSPKSKASTLAIEKAMEQINSLPLDVLDYLKYTPVNLNEEDKYPYDRPDLWEKIQYLPTLIKDMQFYEPSNKSSYERALNENYERLRKIKRSTNLKELKKSL